jgi:hypothetical protein
MSNGECYVLIYPSYRPSYKSMFAAGNNILLSSYVALISNKQHKFILKYINRFYYSKFYRKQTKQTPWF